jgi:exodeoxyribonuclease-1
MPPISLYWHDYETFGVDPRRDRPAQFAGVRTDEDLNAVEPPLVLYCQPARDMLPSPDACLVTGITPQKALQEGVPEAHFIAAIHAQMARPGTCALGYNTIRFDDEVTRNCLYRNFFDPYEREWRNGNSRWDIIDMVRLTAALRPEGIEWPRDEQDRPSFRLELLTAANGIGHEGAHDALADVYATIELARLIRRRQPRLYEFCWRHRGKREAAAQLMLGSFRPVLHVSEKYPAEQGCIAVVVALAPHPTNHNGVLVYDLSVEPGPLLELDAEAIRQRIFTRTADLPEGIGRVPLKTVHLNKCPIIGPLSVLRNGDAERLGIDLKRCDTHLQRIKRARDLAVKLEEVFRKPPQECPDEADPDLMLYGGGFFSDADRMKTARLREMTPDELAGLRPDFDDPRLPEMLFRYRARNFPQSLSPDEEARWEAFRRRRLTVPGCGASMVLQDYEARLFQLETGRELAENEREILESLKAYGREIFS